jgi:hypothetical protein
MDPKVAAKISEGFIAGQALDLLDELLRSLVEESLRAADDMRVSHKLSPELSQAILHEIGAYRTIRQRLRLKVTRSTNLRAAEQRSTTGDGAGYPPGYVPDAATKEGTYDA